ncbi:MAG: hypothetical protein PHU68_00525, partial [Paludibacter sp.]|nr:hypothetical protein [Paludibacter sp.]
MKIKKCHFLNVVFLLAFTINALSQPTVSSPANNSEYTKGSNISFTWSNVSNAVYYEIWVDNNSGFGSP